MTGSNRSGAVRTGSRSDRLEKLQPVATGFAKLQFKFSQGTEIPGRNLAERLGVRRPSGASGTGIALNRAKHTSTPALREVQRATLLVEAAPVGTRSEMVLKYCSMASRYCSGGTLSRPWRSSSPSCDTNVFHDVPGFLGPDFGPR